MRRRTIEVAYTVETPLFMAGADQNSAELRLPSFKGVLRFWWRALAWPRMEGDLEAIRQEEAWVFGSSDGGQSHVILSMAPRRQPGVLRKGAKLMDGARVVGEGSRYLGYGLMHAFSSKKTGVEAGELTRPCLPQGFGFNVTLLLRDRDSWSDQRIHGLVDALKALGLFGGMGARSRRGWGSLRLDRIVIDGKEEWQAPGDVDSLVRELARLAGVDGGPERYPEYTAFSSKSRFVVVGGGRTSLHMLDLVGKELLRYRGWGHNGKVLGEPSEKKFKDDHDLMKGMLGNVNKHPLRVAFGLPHNYGKSPSQQVGPADKKLDRRASPLLIHVQRVGNKPVAVVSFFPAVFLPGDRPKISVGGRKIDLAPLDELYRPIESFLDRLVDEKKRKEQFDLAKEVTP